MVAPRVKFRCVHCNRLLSAPAGRVGKALACPKCVQAVTVPMIGAGSELDTGPESPSTPDPMAVGAAAAPPAGAIRKGRDELPGFMAEIAAAIPEDVLAIQPEDIRADVPSLGINFAPADRPELSLEVGRSETMKEIVLPDDWSVEPVAHPNEGEIVHTETWFPRPEAAADVPAQEPASPSLEIETAPAPSIAQDAPRRRAGEVILPASVVLAWSLFVLFALALSFVAGLLVGHHHWKHL